MVAAESCEEFENVGGGESGALEMVVASMVAELDGVDGIYFVAQELEWEGCCSVSHVP